jgi:hypothetical protein
LYPPKEAKTVDCCAETQFPTLTLLLRSLKVLLGTVWKTVTLPYAGVVENAVGILTFWLVLVFYSSTAVYVRSLIKRSL